ncbi:MAG TPA: HEAT repeat domain-containing protein [Spirochaetota bacterium]|nr:HEAT repeat domain-containing protein [Spirochaetota bacterium]
MKSTRSQLEHRGFCDDNRAEALADKSRVELIHLLSDNDPVTRTAAARCLKHHKSDDAIQALCETLVREDRLYTRLEICETLVSFGKDSVPRLSSLLGKIGDNRLESAPGTIFRKKSYPLPRDLAARTISRIGKDALPALADILDHGDFTAAREAIDAIGFICFAEADDRMLSHLTDFARRNTDDDVVRWKIAIALRAFRTPDAASFADEFFADETNRIIREEAVVSVSGKPVN